MRSENKFKSRAGFTLMEMLLVSAILPVVFFAIFANLSSGLRAWKTMNQPVGDEDILLFLDRAQSDFANAFAYAPVPFQGEPDGVSFAGVLPAPKELGGDRGIGRVRYAFDPSRKAVVRFESDVSEIFKDSEPRQKVALAEVAGFSIEYLTRKPGEAAAVWQEMWEPVPGARPLPPAVRLTVERLPAGRQGAAGSRTSTFLVPSGN